MLEGASRGHAALPPSDPALGRLDHVLSTACAAAAAAAAAARPETLNPELHTRTGLMAGGPAAQGAGHSPNQSQPEAGSGRGHGAVAGADGAGRREGPRPGAEPAGEGPRLWRASAALAVLEAFQVGAACGVPGPI